MRKKGLLLNAINVKVVKLSLAVGWVTTAQLVVYPKLELWKTDFDTLLGVDFRNSHISVRISANWLLDNCPKLPIRVVCAATPTPLLTSLEKF
jgi:hypothetical protein